MNRKHEQARRTAACCSRRTLLDTVTVAGVAAVATACGAVGHSPGGGTSGGQPYTLTWAIRSNARPEEIDGLIRQYGALRPHVTVERYDAWGGGSIAGSLEKLAAGLAAAVPIDLVNGHVNALQLVESIDILQPFDDLIRKDRFDLGRYGREFLESTGRYAGRWHALPYAYGSNVIAVIYNRSLFAAAGAPEPSTDWARPWPWDAFREAMRRLTRTEGGKQVQVGAARFGHWVTTPPLLWEARWLADDFRAITCDAPPAIDAYTRYLDLHFKDRIFAASPGAELGGGDPFLNGKAGITTVGGGSPLGYARQIQGIDWSLATVPKGKVASLDLASTVLGIGKPAKDRVEAWEFLKFLADQSRLATAELRLPAILSDAATWTQTTFAPWPNSNASALVEGIRVARPQDPIIRHPQWQRMEQEVLAPGWSEVLAERKGVVEFLREARPRLQAIVDEHVRRWGQRR